MENIHEDVGKPVLADQSDELKRARRVLISVSCLVIFIIEGKINVEKFSFLGLVTSTPDPKFLAQSILFVLAYLTLNFMWHFYEYAQIIRIRVTGSRYKFPSGTAIANNSNSDQPDDPKQSNLYYWWSSTGFYRDEFSRLIVEGRNACKILEEYAQKPILREANPNWNHVTQAAHKIDTSINGVGRNLETIFKEIDSGRIPVSLERFDKCFRNFKVSQIARIIFLDLLVPAALVSWAAFDLYEVYSNN